MSSRDGGALAPYAGEVEAVLEPMLAAIVRLAGASAATLQVIAADGMGREPVIAIGIPGSGESGGEAVAAWCGACAESRDAAAECVRQELCGHAERFPVDRLGPVCKHIVAVPLRHRGAPVGALDLMFESPRPLPETMTPLLRATGDLLGMTLDNARLARENLRIRLADERQSLAGEVHDALAQGLTYMRMRMSLLRDAIRRNDAAKAQKFCSDIDETLGSSQRRLRELITCFRARIDPQGLVHALADTSERFFDRTGIALEFVNRAPNLAVSPESEIEIFYIVQEALANVCRHAQANSAKLVLTRDDAGYVIAIEDDGIGMAASPGGDPAAAPGHFGLGIMQERARRLGGRLDVRTAAAGTRVELRFPAVSDRDRAPAGAPSEGRAEAKVEP